MFQAEIRYSPVNPSFTIYKWGLRGSKLYKVCFRDDDVLCQCHRIIMCYYICTKKIKFKSKGDWKGSKNCKKIKQSINENFTEMLHFLITKTYLYNFDPLKPHFYIEKLGFTGVYIIFLISAQNIDCGYSLEPPQRGGSNEYPQSVF